MIITLARKPLGGSVVQCCLQHGCGALNVDASRIFCGVEHMRFVGYAHKTPIIDGDRSGLDLRNEFQHTNAPGGRFPANVLLMPTPDVLAGFPDTGKSTGTKNGSWRTGHQYSGGYSGAPEGELGDEVGYGDSGTAARFFKQVQGGVPDGKA